MSAIAGMIDWRGAPVGPAVRKALAALALHGRDGEGFWDGGEVALGWRQTILHQEDHADSQPLTGGGGRFKLAFDGRLDNREELARLLSLEPERARNWPDSAYVMAAFEKWGEDCVPHLLGDFAFAVWDGGKRELFLARDHMGVRPLVYYCGPHFFAFASHPAALFTNPEIPRKIGDTTIARHLMFRVPLADRTYFDNILRIPSGHAMRVAPAGTRLQAYWRVEDTPDIRFARDDDYVAAFRERFAEAVRCRLRSIHPVGSHLSSGWDSSSVTSVAAGLLAQEGRSLHAYTSVPRKDWVPVYKVPGQISDEGPLAATVAARFANIDHVRVEGPGIWDFAALDHCGKNFGAPVGTCHNIGWYSLLHCIARSQGVRVMLTGGSGNFTISFEGTKRLALLLRQGKLVELLREWRAARALGRSYKNLLYQSFMPLLPKEFGFAALAAVGHRPPLTAETSMLSTMLLSEARSIERADAGRLRLFRQDFLQRLYLRGQDGALGHNLAAWDIDVRDPTVDKRIVMYCYAIPDDQFFLRGQARRLLRRAMTGVLPDVILNQKGRGRQAADWVEAAVKARHELLEEITRQAATERLTAVLDVEKMRNVIRSMSPNAIAAEPQIAHSYHYALVAIALGRFVRRFLEAGEQ